MGMGTADASSMARTPCDTAEGQSLGELLSRVVAMRNGLWGITEDMIREG